MRGFPGGWVVRTPVHGAVVIRDAFTAEDALGVDQLFRISPPA